MKQCKQRNKDGWNSMLYLRKESQGFIKPNSKADGCSNHGLFTFLMVYYLGISIVKDME